MLYFEGPAFTQSATLRFAYASFLYQRNDACAYFSLDCADTTLLERHVEINGESATVESTKFTFLSDLSQCVVSSTNFRCYLKKDFSYAAIRPSYLKGLSHSSFQRLNEVIYQFSRLRALFIDMLVLHASAVVHRDEVILFSGTKGAGKSTQARLWLENTDSWVLNYDKPVVKLDGERVLVSGSPWGGKEDLAINEVRPAKALFFVHQAKENRVVRLSAAQAYAQAHLNYFVYPLNEDIENRYNDAIIQLVKKVPVFDLYCTATAEAVTAVKRVLYPEEE